MRQDERRDVPSHSNGMPVSLLLMGISKGAVVRDRNNRKCIGESLEFWADYQCSGIDGLQRLLNPVQKTLKRPCITRKVKLN